MRSLKSLSIVCIIILISIISSNPTKASTIKLEIGLASNFSDVSSSSSNPFGNYFVDGIGLALRDKEKELKAQNLEITIKKFDYGTDQTKIVSVVNDAVKSNVIAVIGYNYSSHALVAAPLHVQNKLPMITPSATANRLSSFDAYIHPTCFDNSFMGSALARIAKEDLKAKRVAIVTAADCAYCQDLTQAFKSEFEKTGYTTKVFSVLDSDMDFSRIANEIKSESTFQAILVPNHELTSAKIISAVLNTGLNIPFLGGDGWGNVGEEFFGIIKDRKLDGYSISHWNKEDPSPNSRNFVKSYTESFGKEPNDTSVLAYDSMMYLLNIILKEKAYSRLTIESALLKDRKYQGVTGDFIFKNGKSPKKSLVVLKAKSQNFKFLKTLRPKI